jgi:hypothetical protein
MAEATTKAMGDATAEKAAEAIVKEAAKAMAKATAEVIANGMAEVTAKAIAKGTANGIAETTATATGHRLVRFRFCTRTIRTPHLRFKTYMNPFPCQIANPSLFVGDTQKNCLGLYLLHHFTAFLQHKM